MNDTFPYQFIAIEGNIGAGKTTLSNQLAAEYGCRLILVVNSEFRPKRITMIIVKEELGF